jgi:hypothetical protein
MKLELSEDDAQFLYEQVVRHAHEIELELARTDKRELQRALAEDLAKMQRIVGTVGAMLETPARPPR